MKKKNRCLLIAAIGLLTAACASGAPPASTAPSAASPMPAAVEPTPTPSPVPALAPTRTRAPTPTPPPLTASGGPEIESFLLTPDDLPAGYSAFDVEIEFEQEHEGIISAITHFHDKDDGVIENKVAIVVQGQRFSLNREEPGLAPADAPTVGDASQAFLGKTEDGRTWASLWFYMGNAFVSIELEGGTGVATIDNAVRLARIVERRLTSPVPPVAYISFPDELDKAGYSKYFKSITLGKYDFGSGTVEVTPATTFEPGPEFMICSSMKMRTPAPNLAIGLFDLRSQTYRLKHVQPEEFSALIPQCEFPHDLPEGSYEYRVAVADAWVAALPFQVGAAGARSEATMPAEPTARAEEPEAELTASPLPPAAGPLTVPGGVRIEDYLLSSSDLPPGYELGNVLTQIERDWQGERLTARALFISPAASLSHYLAVSPHPFTSGALEIYGMGSQPADAPVIGEGSKAYTDKSPGITSYAGLVFYKGNALVEIRLSGATASVTLDLVVKLAQAAEARLPARVSTPAPIAMPEKLDQAAYSRYFKSITFGTMKEGMRSLVPTTTLTSSSMICSEKVSLLRVPKYSFGIYSFEEKAFILKQSEAQELMTGSTLWCSVPGILPVPSGRYEYRVAVGDVLVAVIPFEVQ